MKPNEIKLSDWARILLGNVPPEFYLELVIRAFFIYFLLMLSMRLMGKRMAGQVSRLELATITALASAIGVPILAPERGLVPAVIICGVVVLVSRHISRLSVRNERFELQSQGGGDSLLEDGVLRFRVMRRVRVTRERLFAHLRSEQMTHLGTVKRVYMEADGNFAIIAAPEEKPGLSVLPASDHTFQTRRQAATDLIICRTCGIKKEGNTVAGKGRERCGNCGGNGWTNAVTTQKS
jgi:uncharacterized membrane protein YcaP (DUF421 family)